MRRETQNVLIVLLGAALLKLAATGEYLRYVLPAHLPWLLGAGGIILGLGAVAVWRDLRAHRARAAATAASAGGGGQDAGGKDPGGRGVGGAEAAGAETACGVDSGHTHSTRMSWMLLAPVLAVFLIAPPALGADSVQRSAERGPAGGPAPSEEYDALPAGDLVPLPMSEFVRRASWDEGSLEGRSVELTGFLVHEDGAGNADAASGDEVLLARMVIACCAADAYPATVVLGGDAEQAVRQFAEDDWVEVQGTLVAGSATEENLRTPELAVDEVREVPEPAQPYE